VSGRSPISSRHVISKRELKLLADRLAARLPAAASMLGNAGRVEVAKIRGDGEVVIVDGVAAILLGETVFPTLLAAYKLGLRLPTVVVDMGAVGPILNGADVMAPGIVRYDEFGEGDVVYVADQERGRVFAVGVALVSSSELKGMRRGKVVKNLHYAGDRLWEILKSIGS